MTRITSTLHDEQCTFLIISRSGTASYKTVEKIKTHILRTIIFLPESRAFYEVTWKNIVDVGKAT